MDVISKRRGTSPKNPRDALELHEAPVAVPRASAAGVGESGDWVGLLGGDEFDRAEPFQ
jgi:hypothetical protein